MYKIAVSAFLVIATNFQVRRFYHLHVVALTIKLMVNMSTLLTWQLVVILTPILTITILEYKEAPEINRRLPGAEEYRKLVKFC